MKRFLIITIAVALAMAGIAVPLTHAQTSKSEEECDLEATSSVSVSSTESGEVTEKCDLEAIPAESPATIQSEDTLGSDVKKTQAIPQVCLTERNKDAQDLKPEPAKNSPSTRKVKEVATRKPCREMDDREMDGVAGGITGSFDITGNGNMVLTDESVQSISLSDQAQQNLSSLVNIISVNSTIQVMMNLNVNINSTVGTVNQGNTGTQTGPP